jgi:hypothetical protein
MALMLGISHLQGDYVQMKLHKLSMILDLLQGMLWKLVIFVHINYEEFL